MTSKNSWTKIFKIDIMERIHIAVLMLVAGLLLYPFSAFYTIQTRFNHYNALTEKSLLEKEMLLLSGCKNPILYIFVAICATVLGVTALTFLHSREKSDFYLSFPAKREEHYIGRFLGGIALFASLFLIVELTLFGVLQGASLRGDFGKTILEAYGAGISYFILLYSITFLAMILTGKVIIGILGTLVFDFFGSVIFGIFSGLLEIFCKTCVMENMDEKLMAYSPVLKFGSFGLMRVRDVCAVMIFEPLLWAVPVVALGIILIRKRPGEGAQRSMAFKIDAGINLLISVPLALAAGLFMEAGQNMGDGRVSEWIYVGAILFALLITWLMDFILSGSIRAILQKKRLLLTSVLLTGAILTGFYFGGKHYDAAIPEEKDMAEVMMDDVMIQRFVHMDASEMERQYVPATEKTYRIIKKLSEQDFKQDDAEVKVFVKLTNGKVIQRRYKGNSDEIYKYFSEMYGDEAALRRYLGVDKILKDNVVLESGSFLSEWDNVDISADQSARILSAYRKDLDKVRLTDVINELSVAAFGGRIGKYQTVMLPVTEDFTETLQVMKALGMNYEINKKVSDIDYIEIYHGEMDASQGMQIRDPEKIKEILEKAALDSARNPRTDLGHSMQHGMIQYKNGDIVSILLP